MSKQRLADDCRYRSISQSGDAICGLLKDLSGVEQAEHCLVPAGACEACCESFEPSETDPNPVVASLLFQLSEKIIECDGVAGCSRSTAMRLRTLADECLPKTVRQESDRPTAAIPDYSQASTRSLDEMIPADAAESSVARWAVGVTTAPRRLATVDDSLDSLRNAGWDHVRLFLDSSVEIADRHADFARTLREPKVGAWSNFYLSLAELLMREPEADAYLMIQDDVLFFNHKGVREYLERVLWPVDGPCMASLFCPRNYTQPDHGWCVFDGEWVWGAQALVFSCAAAQRFLADSEVVAHRWNKDYEGSFGIDVLVGRWAARAAVPIYFPTPSLVQHIGHVSALWGRAHIIGPRRADRFAGDEDSL